jgi:raffinose/stachyose/melibiose transport system permease protein
MRKYKHIKEIIISTIIIIFLAVNLSPLLIVLSSSFRRPNNAKSPLALFIEFSLDSYKMAIKKMSFSTAFMNSVIITVASVILLVIITSLASYALARLKTKLSIYLNVFFMAGMIVSAQMSIVPINMIVRKLGMSNTRIAPILLFITCSIPFSVLLYTNFIKSSVPISLEEAAIVDGAGYFTIYFKIVMPLITPATTAVVITQGVSIWNDFFISLMFLSDKALKTLPLAMLNFVGDMENPTQWNILFAACILCSLPLIVCFSFLQKYFMSGLTVGAVKG